MTNSALATREPKAALVAGGDVAAIIPRSIEEAFRLAGAIYTSGMAPRSFNSSEQVMVAIMAGAELGFAPFQAVQAFAIINNRPCIWGDAIPALLWRDGFVIEEWFDDDDKATKAFCKITRPDSGATTERTFSLDDAKKANLLSKSGTWQTNQKRMLQMRARGFCARDCAADVLKGFQIREEVEDYQHVRDVTPQATGMRARLEARTAVGGFDPDHVSREIDAALAGDRIPDHDPETGEVIDAQVDAPADDDLPIRDDTPEAAREPEEPNKPSGGGEDLFPGDRPTGFTSGPATPDPEDWAVEINGKLDACEREADIDALLADPDNLASFRALEKGSPAMAKALNAAITGKRKALKDRERSA